MCIRDRCKLTHSRLTRWVLALQEYNFSWEYIKGIIIKNYVKMAEAQETFAEKWEKFRISFFFLKICCIPVSYTHLWGIASKIPFVTLKLIIYT